MSCKIQKDRHQQKDASACQPSRRSRTSIKDVEKAAGKLDPALLYDIPLIPVDCKFDVVQEKPDNVKALKSIIQKERRANGCKVTVLFAIRRPGCGNCREHGRQLTEISGIERDVAFVGAMKHGAGVDDAALLDFYQQYYRFPLFKDSDWKIYNAMGGRKLSVFKAIRSIPRLEARYKKKGIPNIPFGGDIWTQGGILIFDREGNLRYTHYEKYGEELDMDEIRFAIRQARLPLPGEHTQRRDSIAISIDAMSGSMSGSTTKDEEANISEGLTDSTRSSSFAESSDTEDEPPTTCTYESTNSVELKPSIQQTKNKNLSTAIPPRMSYAEARIAGARRQHVRRQRN